MLLKKLNMCFEKREQNLQAKSLMTFDPPSLLRDSLIREKAFREMKKDVGMTTAQKSKETIVQSL